MKLLGISGSLRAGSINTAALRAAAELAPEGADLTIATLHDIPLYDGDLEASEGVPAAVTALAEAIRASDAVVFSTPEYTPASRAF
jgi:NAD(P)H-dependent FMN reductase